MAIVTPERLANCGGFRVELTKGLVGWVEETWLDQADEVAALAVRLVDGRRGLLLVEAVGSVVPESETVLAAEHPAVLELDPPRVETFAANGGRPIVAASWRTTGAEVELPPPPGPLRQALLALRPWRLAPPPGPEAERPLWLIVAQLYIAIALLVGLLIALAFLVARLVTGAAY